MLARHFETHGQATNTVLSPKRLGTPPHVELVPVKRLRSALRNVRTHSKMQFSQIANSILRFGWTYPMTEAQPRKWGRGS